MQRVGKEKPRRRQSVTAGLALAWLGLLRSGLAEDPAERILTLGRDAETFLAVFGEQGLSIFAEAVPAEGVLDALQGYGGPTYESVEPLTRPVTLTVHAGTLEDVLRKILDGHNFVFRYRDGRLAHVSVLPLIPGRGYKTPLAVETQKQWMQIEIDRLSAKAGTRSPTQSR